MKISWRVYFGLLLIALSALLYFIHFLIFQDLYHIQIYLLGDLAFLPIEVLLVVLVVDRVVSYQERRNQLEKINMAIGTYFSEVGTPLLKAFSDFEPNIGRIRDELTITGAWTDRTFAEVSALLKRIGMRSLGAGRSSHARISRGPATVSYLKKSVSAPYFGKPKLT